MYISQRNLKTIILKDKFSEKTGNDLHLLFAVQTGELFSFLLLYHFLVLPTM